MKIDLARIGKILKEKREEKGLSLYDVSERLCLRRTLIGAIEEGDWNPLPHEVYVKGFVRKYASILHADSEVNACFDAPEVAEKVLEKIADPAIEAPHYQQAKPKGRRFLGARFAVIMILCIVMFVFVYDRVAKERTLVAKTETATKAAERSHDEPGAKNVLAVSEVKGNQETGTLAAMSESKKLMITCHERTWISAVIDGKEKKEFMLSPQEIIVLNAKEEFDLLIGNAGGVKLLLNGKDAEFTGKSGEVKRVKLS